VPHPLGFRRVFDLRAKQQLNRGYSDGLARGIEIVATPALFGLLGWLLDGWLGTDPFLAIGLGTFGVAGIFAKLWLGYDRDMIAAESGKPWTRTADAGPPAAPAGPAEERPS
jgi:F0F1-type ATP synthase assembly protein I